MVGAPLVIALVNGMPGEAKRQTEQQFRAILAAASNGSARLEVFALGDADLAPLEALAPDGLIVTGMPPRAAALADEPFWPRLTALADFALDRAIPTVWSCLAAHAAALHLDGIERRRLPKKLSGLLDCARTEAIHPIARDLPWRWRVPHSRYNDVPEDALRARGYRILSRSADAGVDIFLKEFGDGRGAPFLFCQGHPEYDADTLPREYRRDVREYLAGARETYPDLPDGVFDENAIAVLTAFREHASSARKTETLAAFPWAACASGLSRPWTDLTLGLYAAWLDQIARRPDVCARPTADTEPMLFRTAGD